MTELQSRLAQIERDVQITSPESYRHVLLLHNGRDHYADPKYLALYWRLATVAPETGDAHHYLTIHQPVTIGDRTIPFVRQLSLLATMMADSLNINSVSMVAGGSVDTDRLRQGLTIAMEDADLMFLEPTDKFLICVFWESALSVEQLAPEFASWIKAALLNETISVDLSEVVGKDDFELFAGKRTPQSSSDLSQNAVNAPGTCMFQDDQSCEVIDMFGDVEVASWTIRRRRRKKLLCIEVQGGLAYVLDKLSAAEMTLVDPADPRSKLIDRK